MDDYFKRLLSEGSITPQQHLQACLVWSAAYILGMPVPTRMSEVVGCLIMEWIVDRHHLVFEFIDGCVPEWSYSDFGGDEYDGDEIDADDCIVFDYMLRFRIPNNGLELFQSTNGITV